MIYTIYDFLVLKLNNFCKIINLATKFCLFCLYDKGRIDKRVWNRFRRWN